MMTQRLTMRMLQDALAHLERDDTSAAEDLLKRVLKAQPKESNALQLLGLVREAQARDEEAESCYRQSLAGNSRQPHVHYNLGTLLFRHGRHKEAIAALEEALRQKPDYAEAYLCLGQAQEGKGDAAAAERTYLQALRMYPNFPYAKQSLSSLLIDQKRPQEAEDVLREALAVGSPNPQQVAAFQHNLGLALKMQGRFDEALELFDLAQKAVPQMPLVDYNRANTLQGLGRLENAIDSYRKAIAHNPLDIAAHGDLNRLLYRLGRDDELLSSFDEVAMMHPEVAALTVAKGDFLFRLKRYEEAIETYERAARLDQLHVTPHDGMGLIHARMGNFEDAIHSHERAVTIEPDNAPAWTNFAETLLRAGDNEQAKKAAERALAIAPTLQNALGIWGLALRRLCDPSEEDLNDYEKMVQVYELSPPTGYADMESFNRDLNAFLDSVHRDNREPLDQTLRTGTQSADNLFGHGHDIVEQLRAQIDQAVLAYIGSMAEDDRHPLFGRRTRDIKYSASWSSRLHDCGFHTNHVHPMGWISSCYYVALPDAVADEDGKQGWIKFGEPDFDAGFANPIRRTIQPQIGRLVLFPSYMWHGTIPFRSDDARTTVAFDVVPR